MTRAVRLAVSLAGALAGLVAIGAVVFVALSRLGYPFAVEQLEGNSLVEVHRILSGQPLYQAPAVGYVPDGYPPLYFALSAAVARVAGQTYLPLRLVSLFAALACFALLARLVQRETGSLAAGVAAAGVFAATYFATGDWFDVGRVDSLFLALSLASLYAVRRMRGLPGAVGAGLLLAAAALTKQTALAEGAAVLAVLLFTGAPSRRRLARVAALTWASAVGLATLVLGLTSGGWYIYYVFQLMSEHSLTASHISWFWTLLGTAMGLVACAAAIGVRRVPRELLAGCAALVIEGYAALVHSGGSLNDVLPAYLAVALLSGLALGRDDTRWTGTAAGLLVLAQTVLLLASAHPSQAIPSAADRAAGQRLLAGIRAFGGDVAVPQEPALNLLAGTAPAAHPGAVYDVVRATDQAAITDYQDSAVEALQAHQFSAIIADGPGAPFYDPPGFLQDYQECVQPIGQSTLLMPAAAAGLRPLVLWIPWSGISCPDAFRVLEDGATSR
jgi:4-amino-4-deoxy-L-arabinose transferase-like glycosyltransferase